MTLVDERPDVKDSAKYSVAETCRLLGIHRNTLKKYTDAGFIRAGVGKASGRKYYLGSEIIRFWKYM